ncbi:hypothetical protein E6C76_20145 [Pseudothauera nasutitermitis]|uniref:Uncharacterized protein n=1 Tax=Pseudothauera nasutitermitis TaxID=2565930 RepID=A0A4S4AP53_9RHOO|nr:hypothetical protein [Pseudothauera nasutitermitis]THF61396.1 hypothetical protein E6C76_20145 [Pseudothauera nasutitermitis]
MSGHVSKAAAIAAAAADRLATITLANGYHTDAGQRIYRGRAVLDLEDLPAIVLYEEEDLVDRQRAGAAGQGEAVDIIIGLPFTIEATAACDPLHPNVTGHALVADIKRCLFSGDLLWGGLATGTLYVGRTLHPRDDGAGFVRATVQIRVTYSEFLDAP